VLRRAFLFTGFGALLAAAILAWVSSRSVVEPMGAVVTRLRESQKTGLLPVFENQPATIQEIRELMESFNLAAAAVREGRENLQQAYVEFTGSLASSLDARDDYTAGHSRRVSEYSCAIARSKGVTAEGLETIPVGRPAH